MHAPIFALALLAATSSEAAVELDAMPSPRAPRRLIVAGEMGWNSLPGMGLSVSRDVSRDWSVDGGLGIGTSGYRLGVRGRYNLSQGNLRPFVGVGALLGAGLRGEVITSSHVGDAAYTVTWSPFVQAVGGLAYVADNGFACIATLGWAHLLRDNVRLLRGTPNRDQRELIEAVSGSGPVVSLAIGYGV